MDENLTSSLRSRKNPSSSKPVPTDVLQPYLVLLDILRYLVDYISNFLRRQGLIHLQKNACDRHMYFLYKIVVMRQNESVLFLRKLRDSSVRNTRFEYVHDTFHIVTELP